MNTGSGALRPRSSRSLGSGRLSTTATHALDGGNWYSPSRFLTADELVLHDAAEAARAKLKEAAGLRLEYNAAARERWTDSRIVGLARLLTEQGWLTETTKEAGPQ